MIDVDNDDHSHDDDDGDDDDDDDDNDNDDDDDGQERPPWWGFSVCSRSLQCALQPNILSYQCTALHHLAIHISTLYYDEDCIAPE